MPTKIQELRGRLGNEIAKNSAMIQRRALRADKRFSDAELAEFDDRNQRCLVIERSINDTDLVHKSNDVSQRHRQYVQREAAPPAIIDQLSNWGYGNAGEPREIRITPGQDRIARRAVADRALSKGTDTAGGDVVADEPITEFQSAMHNAAPILDFADVRLTDTGGPFAFPTVVDDGNTGKYRTEAAARRTNQDPTFGQVVLGTFNVDSDIIIVSEDLFEDLRESEATELFGAVGLRLGERLQTEALVGTGTNAMQGLMTGGTVATLSIGNSAVVLTAAHLYGAEKALNARLREDFDNVRWVLSESALDAIRAIDAEDIYTMEDDGGRVLGYRYLISPDVAAMGTNGNRFAALADMRALKVRMVRGSRLSPITPGRAGQAISTPEGRAIVQAAGKLRLLEELYHGNGQLGVHARARADSKVVDPGADRVVIMANGS